MANSLSKKQLREAYGVTEKTFSKWLKRIPGNLIQEKVRVFTPKEVELIFEHLGIPESIQQ